MSDKALDLALEAKGIFARADQEGREVTPAEREYIEGLLDQAAHEKSRQRIDAIGRQIGPAGGSNGLLRLDSIGGAAYIPSGGGLGDVFVNSEGWKAISDPATRPQRFTTGEIDVGALSFKAGTMLESGQGAGLIPVPQVAPGVVQTLFQPVGIADIFAGGLATSSSVRYVLEGTATSGAAGVLEAGVKPASDVALSTVDEPVRKIATVLTISDELIEDAPTIQNYLNSRLSLFCRAEEDRQLLRGTASPEVVGIFQRSGINLYGKAAGDDNATALAKAIANTAGSCYLQPDHVIMHPTNWLNTRLLRDGTGGTVGQFYGGGPFTGAYGSPTAGAATPGSFGGMIWNTPVFLSTVVGLGTALVGSFTQGAQLWSRAASASRSAINTRPTSSRIS